jgi:20S proteasome subunit alpha 6
MVAQQKDREQFLKSYMFISDSTGDEGYNLDNVLEIMLRLIRGDRPLIGSSAEGHHHHHYHHHHNSSNNIVHPILQAAVKSDYSLIANQTHTSLAVIAMFRVLQDTATKYGGEDAKKDVENRVKDIIKALPQHMINKSLDATFQKWSNPSTSSSSKNASTSNTKGHR